MKENIKCGSTKPADFIYLKGKGAPQYDHITMYTLLAVSRQTKIQAAIEDSIQTLT